MSSPRSVTSLVSFLVIAALPLFCGATQETPQASPSDAAAAESVVVQSAPAPEAAATVQAAPSGPCCDAAPVCCQAMRVHCRKCCQPCCDQSLCPIFR